MWFQRSELTPLRLVWLVLALIGAALGLFASGAGIQASEWVAFAALAIWCGVETSVRRNWFALLTFPAMALGIGCALPLYLFLRSRRIA